MKSHHNTSSQEISKRRRVTRRCAFYSFLTTHVVQANVRRDSTDNARRKDKSVLYSTTIVAIRVLLVVAVEKNNNVEEKNSVGVLVSNDNEWKC